MDKVQVGSGCYDMQNVRLDGGKLQADYGYSFQIAAPGGTAYGGCIARFGGTTEYIAVIGDKVYKAAPGDAAWTQIATGVTQSAWEFAQFGNIVYAINATDGIRFHTVGGTDWVGGSKPSQPANSSLLTFTEKVFNNGTNPDRSIKASLQAATFVITGLGSTQPTVTFEDYGFVLNIEVSSLTGDEVTIEATLGSTHNLQYNDAWYMEVTERYINGGDLRIQPGSMRFSLYEGTTENVPLYGSEEFVNHPPSYRKAFYVLDKRSTMDGVTKLVWKFTNTSLWMHKNDKLFIGVKCGDPWQNNLKGFNVADGPIIDSRAYSVAAFTNSNSAESNLSVSFDSLETPGGNAPGGPDLGSYTRVTCLKPASWDTTWTPSTGDKLRFYRKRITDSEWVRVGELTWDGGADNRWEDSGGNNAQDASGNPYIDDKYMEWELSALTRYTGGHNLPPGFSPNAIGAYRASLGIGANYNLYLSRVDSALEYEDLGAIPDRDDPRQGRTVYVDDSRSEHLNMIQGGQVLFLGTKARTYAMWGDFPANTSVPQPIANVGPIGSRAHENFKDGVLVLNADGLWIPRFGVEVAKQFASGDLGSLETIEMTKDIATTFAALGISSSAVVTVFRGEVFVYSGTKWLRLDRKEGRWHTGTFGSSIVQAMPDYTENLRLLTSTGGLIKWNNTSQYNGSPINWYYQTGDIVMPNRCRLSNVYMVGTGAPTVEIVSYDGKEGSVDKTWTLDPTYYALKDFESSVHYGTKFSFKIAGVETDTVISCELEFEPVGGGGSR